MLTENIAYFKYYKIPSGGQVGQDWGQGWGTPNGWPDVCTHGGQ